VASNVVVDEADHVLVSGEQYVTYDFGVTA